MNIIPSNLRAIFFDVDGTILDSKKLIVECYQKSFQDLRKTYSLDFALPLDSEISNLIGVPGAEIFETITSLSSHSPYYEPFQDLNYLQFSRAMQQKEAPLMPKTLETFQFLKKMGVRIGLASNASLSYLQDLIQVYELPVDIPLVALNEEIQTKAEILKTYQDLLSFSDEQLLMVGDRIFDIQAASKNHMPSIALMSGIGYEVDPQELQGATLLLQDMPAFFSWVEDHILSIIPTF